MVPVSLKDRRLHLKEEVHWSLPLSHGVIVQNFEKVRGGVRAPKLTPQLPFEGVPVLNPIEALGVDDGLRSTSTARSRSTDVCVITGGPHQVFDGPDVALYLLVPLQRLTSRGFSLEVRDRVSGHKVRHELP